MKFKANFIMNLNILLSGYRLAILIGDFGSFFQDHIFSYELSIFESGPDYLYKY